MCLKTASDLDPADGRWAYLAGLYLSATDPAAAVPYLRRAVDGTFPPDRPGAAEVARLKLAETLLAADQPAAAGDVLGPGLPPTVRGKVAAARVALAAGDDKAAAARLAEAAADPAATRQVFSLQSQLYQRQNRPAAAAAAATRASRTPEPAWPDPVADPVARRNRTRAGRLDEAGRLLRLNRPAEAVRVLTPLCDQSPDAKPFIGLAQALDQAGDRAGAVRALETGLKTDPADPTVLYQLGFHQFEDGEALWAAGRPAEARDRFAAAVGRFDQTLTRNPAFSKAILLKGVALQRFLGRPAEGTAMLKQFATDRPDIAEGHFLYGQALAAGGDAAGARVELARAADLAVPGDRRAADALAALPP